ncbi:MAG: TauD/TfdA family dioxygenase [Burkholderiaceae bacterium]|nr:TauD/TfdA family dioxygenase [Burkholderiaceae bacterium]
MKIQPLTEYLGAEVTGVDLMRDQKQLADPLRAALLDRGVLIVRDQVIDAKQFVEVARGFGPIEPYESTVKQFLMPDHPEIIVLSNMERDGKPLGLRDAGQYWHTDRSYVEEPAWSSMLHAVKLPVDEHGVTRGNTQFTSSIATFAALPEAMKSRLRKLRAVHRYIYRYTKAPQDMLPPVEHPVVLRHPYNERESLYVNRGFTSHIVGLSEQDSQALLEELYAHVAQPQFVYTHQWRPGDMLLWDNYATQHNAVADYQLPLERLMWRTTIRKPHGIAAQ